MVTYGGGESADPSGVVVRCIVVGVVDEWRVDFNAAKLDDVGNPTHNGVESGDPLAYPGRRAADSGGVGPDPGLLRKGRTSIFFLICRRRAR